MHKIFIHLIISLLFIGPALATQDEIAAIVGNDIITTQDIDNRLKLVLNHIAETNNNIKIDREQLISSVVQNLIDEKLFLHEAEKHKLLPTSEEIIMMISSIEQQNHLTPGSFLKNLKQKKISEDTILDQIKAQIAWGKIINYRLRPLTNVSEKEVEEDLMKNIPENTIVSFFRIQTSLKNNEKDNEYLIKKLNSLREKITNCAQVEKLVTKASKEFSTDNLSVPINQLHPNLKDIIKISPIGKASKVIKTDDSLEMIVVCSRDFAGISKEDKHQIKEIILQRKLSLQSTHYLHDLRKKTFIEIRL